MKWKSILPVVGRLIGLFSLFLLPAMLVAVYYHEWFSLEALFGSFLFGGVTALGCLLLGRGKAVDLYRREVLLVVALCWLLSAFIGALPFVFSGATHSFTDAYFESMSGLTTTGSTILTDIESNPRSILFWRSMLHFVGGLGIVVLFVSIFGQSSGVRDKSLFRAEVPGPFDSKERPRIRDVAMDVAKVYIILNVAETILLALAGMPLFEAVNHAMATIATGGFSPKNTSIFGYNSAIQWIIIVFMLLAGTNFSLHLGLLRGKLLYFKDPEFKIYLAVTIGGAIIAAGIIWIIQLQNAEEAIPYITNPEGFNIRDTMFMVFSLGTSTGFGTVDYDGWPPVLRLFLLFLMFSGACAGSTSGGLKMIRWIVIGRVLPFIISKKASPNEIRHLRIGGVTLQESQVLEILKFTALWVSVIFVNSTLVCLFTPNLEVLEAISAVTSTMSNIGPAFGALGPTDNFAFLPNATKWVFSIGMVMGRLEIYPLLILMSPRFWR